MGEEMDKFVIKIDDDDDAKRDETVSMACLMAVSLRKWKLGVNNILHLNPDFC